MGTAGGPKIVTDGLLVNLDASDQKSFPGEPTTNVVTNWNLDTGWAKGYTEDIVFNEIPPPPGVNAPTVGFRNDDTSGDGYWYSYGNYAPQDSSTTYTISVYAKTNQTDSRFFLRAYTADNSEVGRHWTNGIYLTAADGWKRIVWPSFTTVANNESDSLSFRYDNLYQSGYTRLWLCAPQMEAKSYATPFTTGTRGTTVATGGGWKDRSGNGRNAQIVNGTKGTSDKLGGLDFDGADDRVTIPAFTYTPYCLDFWLYNNNTVPNNNGSIGGPSTYQTLISFGGGTAGVNLGGWTSSATNEAMHIWSTSGGNKLTYTRTQVPSGYHHWVFNWNGSSYDIWVDGVKLTTYAGTSGHAGLITYTDQPLYIGTNNSTYEFYGKIFGFKMYGTQLTDEQVRQNFKAKRSRFGL